MLNFKTLYGDLLVFKNKNDCMTINRNGHPILVHSIEVDGEPLDHNECDYDLSSHPRNTFTEEEIDYFIKHYEYIVGPNY